MGDMKVSGVSNSGVMELFGLYNLPRVSRSRMVVPARWRKGPEERGVWGGCTSGSKGDNSSGSSEREEYGGKLIMMMNMPSNATTRDSHSQRGFILM